MAYLIEDFPIILFIKIRLLSFFKEMQEITNFKDI